MEQFGIIIASISLLFTLFTFFFYEHRLKKLDIILKDYEVKTIAKKEEDDKKASIKANIINSGKGERIIKIYNDGKSNARNIRIEIMCDYSSTFISGKEKFPFDLLNPQENTEIRLRLTNASPDTIKIFLFWDDEFGKNRKHEQILTL